MIRRHPRSTRTHTRFPSPTLFRSQVFAALKTVQGPGWLAPAGDLLQCLFHPAQLGRFVIQYGDTHGMRFLDLESNGHHQGGHAIRSEEHTSELQSLMRISYAVFCLKKKTKERKT